MRSSISSGISLAASQPSLYLNNSGPSLPGAVQPAPSTNMDVSLICHDMTVSRSVYRQALKQLPLQMQFVPDYKGSTFNPEWLEKAEIAPSAERVKFHTEYAELWNKVSSRPEKSEPSFSRLVFALRPMSFSLAFSLSCSPTAADPI